MCARPFDLASSDTGQARPGAAFPIARWNGEDHCGFDLATLSSLGRSVADDVARVFAFLGQHCGAIYPDAVGYRMAEVLRRWRPIAD